MDAFELWCWRRLLRVPWTARVSNQSILKEISPEYSLKGLMLKLKLHHFGNLMQRADSMEKTLMLGKIKDGRRRGRQRVRWVGWHHRLDGHGFEWTPGVGDGQGGLACCGSWGRKESDTTERLTHTHKNVYHNGIKIEINSRKIYGKFWHVCKPNNTHLNKEGRTLKNGCF